MARWLEDILKVAQKSRHGFMRRPVVGIAFLRARGQREPTPMGPESGYLL